MTTATMTMPDMLTDTVDIKVNDVSGQKKARVRELSRQATVGELVRGLLGRLGLVTVDAAGKAIEYRARLNESGRNLNAGELVGDVLESGASVTLVPKIHAG